MCELGGSQQRVDGNSLPLALQRLWWRASQDFPSYGGVARAAKDSPGGCLRLSVGSLLWNAGRVQLFATDWVRCCGHEHSQWSLGGPPLRNQGLRCFLDHEHRKGEELEWDIERNARRHRLCGAISSGSEYPFDANRFDDSFNALAAAAASTNTLCSLIIEFIGRVFDGKDSILCLVWWNTLSRVEDNTFSRVSWKPLRCIEKSSSTKEVLVRKW